MAVTNYGIVQHGRRASAELSQKMLQYFKRINMCVVFANHSRCLVP